jgi:class 3 adenylate cyclase
MDDAGRDTSDAKLTIRDIPTIPMWVMLATATAEAMSLLSINRRIQMRKINMFAAALILIGLGAWVVTTNSRVAASTPVGIDPLQMMAGATNLPTSHYVDYEVIFNWKGWLQASLGSRVAGAINRSPGGGSIQQSDLRGFTLIPLLNDYSDVIISAIHERGGDVLKLIGDGTLAIFTAENRSHACNAALSAATAAREGVAELNKRRAAKDIPVSDMYLGLHVGKVFYGNVGSRERLDFTVVGPAVNEASRIAAMCRSLDQPVLISAAFASVGDIKSRLVSVGRYALRGVAHPQELFTLEA